MSHHHPLLIRRWLRESILRSVTTAGRLRAKETSKGKSEEREDEGSKHEAEESKDHRVLDRGGVEGQRCGTVTSNCVEPKPPLPFFLCYLLSFHKAGKAAAQNHQKRSSCRHSSFSLLYRSSPH